MFLNIKTIALLFFSLFEINSNAYLKINSKSFNDGSVQMVMDRKNEPYNIYIKAHKLANLNKEQEAYKYYLLAKKQYLAIDSIDRAMQVNLDLAHLISSQGQNNNDYKTYLDEYMAYAIEKNEPIYLAKGYSQLAIYYIDIKEYDKSLHYFNLAFKQNKAANDTKLQSKLNLNIANLYNEYLRKPKVALTFLKEDLKYLNEVQDIEGFYHNYVNQAASYYYLGDYKQSIKYLLMADQLPLKNFKVKAKQHIYMVLYINYETIGDYENAYKYLTLNKKISDSINEIKQNIAISEIQTRYQTKEKEVENLQLKERAKTRNILLVTLIVLLIASFIIGLLIIKNSRRKQKILQQEKLIEQQKLEKALKDYELNSIDLMLEGQEKERQRIANDLHDNLGSMLATLKLNFENLKLRKHELRDEETKLYDRTDELIEEAYQKVRRLAHAQNAGVLANEGLIPALQKLTEKISIPNKLIIEVIPFGFNERIENSLEIAIFRMVQELATNIIKHSQATEASIHLTRHEDNINIIVEDNGIGFKNENIAEADGMGINSIQKKCEQLGGTMTIDSTPGKGTTIIIDIPV